MRCEKGQQRTNTQEHQRYNYYYMIILGGRIQNKPRATNIYTRNIVEEQLNLLIVISSDHFTHKYFLLFTTSSVYILRKSLNILEKLL